METLNFFDMNFNNNGNECLSLAHRCRYDTAVSDKFVANGVCHFSFEKHAFADQLFTVMLV